MSAVAGRRTPVRHREWDTMTKRHKKDEKLDEVAKEHVRHISGETAAGRTDPAATDTPAKKGGASKQARHDRIASPGGSDVEDTGKS